MSQLLIPTILLIDQDDVARISIASLLELHGMNILAAATRHDGLRIAESTIIDLVICDMQVNDQSGLEIANAIREIPQRDDVPFLFLSAVQTPDVILRRHQAGSALHLKKPFDHDVFVELVERALWMPHLVQSHIQAIHGKEEEVAQPHFSFPPIGTDKGATINTPISHPNPLR